MKTKMHDYNLIASGVYKNIKWEKRYVGGLESIYLFLENADELFLRSIGIAKSHIFKDLYFFMVWRFIF